MGHCGNDSDIVLMIVTLAMQVCADTLIGDDQIRGVSGGQRKRVTTGDWPHVLQLARDGTHSQAFLQSMRPVK